MGEQGPHDGRVLHNGDDPQPAPTTGTARTSRANTRCINAAQVHAPRELTVRGLGRRLFPFLTVRDNLLLGAHNRHARPHREESLARVETLFPVLRERRAQLAYTLSGGEQQMVAIARGLMARPRLLMIDEPFLGLARAWCRVSARSSGASTRKGSR